MKTEYKLASGWRLFFVVLGISSLALFIQTTLGLIGLLGYFFSENITIFRSMIMVAFLLFYLFLLLYFGCQAYFFLYKFQYERVILSEKGIEHRSFGYVVYVNWINTKCVSTLKPLGLISGIYVNIGNASKWFGSALKWFGNENPQGEIYIPLSMFVKNWRESELGQQIKQYAPHLFKSVEN